jgi:hypothetical protein
VACPATNGEVIDMGWLKKADDIAMTKEQMAQLQTILGLIYQRSGNLKRALAAIGVDTSEVETLQNLAKLGVSNIQTAYVKDKRLDETVPSRTERVLKELNYHPHAGGGYHPSFLSDIYDPYLHFGVPVDQLIQWFFLMDLVGVDMGMVNHLSETITIEPINGGEFGPVLEPNGEVMGGSMVEPYLDPIPEAPQATEKIDGANMILTPDGEALGLAGANGLGLASAADLGIYQSEAVTEAPSEPSPSYDPDPAPAPSYDPSPSYDSSSSYDSGTSGGFE